MTPEDAALIDRLARIHPRNARYAEAYLRMAEEARYRPQAPSDGWGHIRLSLEQVRDRPRLEQEAIDYALMFAKEEDGQEFRVGCSNFTTNRAFIWTIEAARCLASGADGDAIALRLLKMAATDVKSAIAATKRRRRTPR